MSLGQWITLKHLGCLYWNLTIESGTLAPRQISPDRNLELEV